LPNFTPFLMTSYRATVPSKKAVSSLARNYNTLNYHLHLCTLLSNFYPVEKLERRTKYELHRLMNAVLMKYYCGEEVMKYKLASYYFEKSNIVGAYEINVNSSRADFVAINGHSTSFEIKSGLDNLSKLPKQIHDYSRVFDYNCLIVDGVHFDKAKDVLPRNWGLWRYESGEYKVSRRPLRNTSIDPEAQLTLLSKSELNRSFPKQRGLVSDILKNLDVQEVNTIFKQTLKARYKERWQFLTAHQRSIFPIDFQFFFSNNIQPELIYQSH
jgi:hypothetical protein